MMGTGDGVFRKCMSSHLFLFLFPSPRRLVEPFPHIVPIIPPFLVLLLFALDLSRRRFVEPHLCTYPLRTLSLL
jgi:hypothetical protein